MTSNQINMLRHLEDVRHNQTVEQETYRSNVARETETARSNAMSERLKSLELYETSRHNLQNEYIGIANAHELERHNRATEEEINRHNTKEESYTEYLLDPNKKKLEAEATYRLAQADSTGINTFINAGKAIGQLIGWLAASN